MTRDEIREALVTAGGAHAYIDAADGETFILDGAFTLQQLVAIGDVARKALDQQGLAGALNEAAEQFGAERLAKALVEPKVGDTIRATATSKPFYEVGDYARLLEDCEDFWEADFNDSRNATVEGQGFWAIGSERFEVVR